MQRLVSVTGEMSGSDKSVLYRVDTLPGAREKSQRLLAQYLARNRAAMDNGSTLSAQHLTEEGPVCDYSAD